ncbi:hypothetical protein [Halorussus salinus]|uniref:hypothetical protein n=1 Tax=Halorussus salinus TaxID=1364935 RepID=UPI001091F88C|nr:hypothetical protein [Halorussus salinus]
MPSRRTFLAALAATSAFSASGATGASAARADSRSAAPEIAWSRTYAESASLAGLSAVVPREEGHVLLGTEGAAEYRGLAVRTDAAGRPRWTRRLGPPSSSFAAGAPHPDGGVVAAGTTNVADRSPASEPPLSADPWLVRLDERGDLVWARTLQPAAGTGGIEDLTRVGDGGGDGDSDDYLVCGGSRRDEEAVRRPWVARVTAAGHQRWAKTVEGRYRRGNLNAVATAENATVATDGDAASGTTGSDAVAADEAAVYVGGSTRPPESDDYGRSEDALVACLAPDGTTRWQYSADSSDTDSKGSRIEELHADRDDAGVVAVGNRRFAYDDDGQGWHLRLDGTGAVEWDRRHSTGPWNWLSDVAPTPEGYLLVGTREKTTGGGEGETNDGEDANENGPRGAWVLHTDPTGNVVWERTYYDGDYSTGNAIVHVEGREFLIAGRTSGGDASDGDAGWLANVGGAPPPNGRGATEFVADLADRIPPDADAIGLGALLGAGAVTAGRRLLAKNRE